MTSSKIIHTSSVTSRKRGKRQVLKCACGNHAFVACTRGAITIFDVDYIETVAKWNWSTTGDGRYAHRKTPDGAAIFIHRTVLGDKPGQEVDHINGNGMDNRRSNLRHATKAQNQANRHAVVAISGFKGVTPNKKRWGAQISKRLDGVRQTFCLGTFDTKEQAALAYDVAARQIFGEFARTNFSDGAGL